MFDLTRLARGIGFAFLAYLSCIPAGMIVLAILGVTTGKDPGMDFLWWGAVWVFPPLAIVLAVDFFRRLGSCRLTVTQVPAYRFVAVLMVVGAGFGLSAVWIPTVICLVCLAAMCLPTKRKVAQSTWAPSASRANRGHKGLDD